MCHALAVLTLAAAGNEKYEVWAIDQSNSPGRTFGGSIYIWDGHDLEKKNQAAAAVAERIDLSGAATTLCFSKTNANPVRPHMIFFNAAQTHAIVSFVASGHVLILDASTRAPIDCVRTAAGAGGARQAHAAFPRTGHGGDAQPGGVHHTERAGVPELAAAARQRTDYRRH
jgi:hypothetical protein